MKSGPTVLQGECQLGISGVHQLHLKKQGLSQIAHYWIIFCLVVVFIWWIWRKSLIKRKKNFSVNFIPRVVPFKNQYQSYRRPASFVPSGVLIQSRLQVLCLLFQGCRKTSECHWPHSSRKPFAYRQTWLEKLNLKKFKFHIIRRLDSYL